MERLCTEAKVSDSARDVVEFGGWEGGDEVLGWAAGDGVNLDRLDLAATGEEVGDATEVRVDLAWGRADVVEAHE